jgi:RHS repeat-associated protein
VVGGVDELFGRMTSAGISVPLTDALGSVIAETGSAQTVTTSFAYEPYGKTTQTGTSSGNSQQFTGRENYGTGLYYYRARYYSPTTARFTSEDPIGFRGGANTYAYVGGNPIGYIDPLGLYCLSNAAIGAIGGTVGGAVTGGLLGGLGGAALGAIAGGIGGAVGGAVVDRLGDTAGGAIGGMAEGAANGVKEGSGGVVVGAVAGAIGGQLVENRRVSVSMP